MTRKTGKGIDQDDQLDDHSTRHFTHVKDSEESDVMSVVNYLFIAIASRPAALYDGSIYELYK